MILRRSANAVVVVDASSARIDMLGYSPRTTGYNATIKVRTESSWALSKYISPQNGEARNKPNNKTAIQWIHKVGELSLPNMARNEYKKMQISLARGTNESIKGAIIPTHPIIQQYLRKKIYEVISMERISKSLKKEALSKQWLEEERVIYETTACVICIAPSFRKTVVNDRTADVCKHVIKKK